MPTNSYVFNTRVAVDDGVGVHGAQSAAAAPAVPRGLGIVVPEAPPQHILASADGRGFCSEQSGGEASHGGSDGPAHTHTVKLSHGVFDAVLWGYVKVIFRHVFIPAPKSVG